MIKIYFKFKFNFKFKVKVSKLLVSTCMTVSLSQ